MSMIWPNLLRHLRMPRMAADLAMSGLNPKLAADLHSMLGAGYLQAGDATRAIEALTRAVMDDPACARAYFLMGMAYNATGEYRRAVGTFSQAIALRPDKAMYVFARASAWESAGDVEQAMGDLAQVLKLEPNHEVARQRLRRLRQRLSLEAATTSA